MILLRRLLSIVLLSQLALAGNAPMCSAAAAAEDHHAHGQQSSAPDKDGARCHDPAAPVTCISMQSCTSPATIVCVAAAVPLAVALGCPLSEGTAGAVDRSIPPEPPPPRP